MTTLYYSLGIPYPYIGPRVIEDANLTDEKRATVRRTWRERLLSWPWRPWATTKVVITRVPSEQVYLVGNTLVMHPDRAAELRCWMGEAEFQPRRTGA